MEEKCKCCGGKVREDVPTSGLCKNCYAKRPLIRKILQKVKYIIEKGR